MKKGLLLCSVILVGMWIVADSQAVYAQETPEALAESLSRAYQGKDLSSLKSSGAFRRSVRIVIEHSIAEVGGKPKIEDATFRSLRAVDKWFDDRRPGGEDFDFNREVQPLLSCAKGTCQYDRPALLHNTLFLTKFTYGTYRGKVYLKAIYFVDGD